MAVIDLNVDAGGNFACIAKFRNPLNLETILMCSILLGLEIG
jgi:hypothetical protein